MAGERTEAAVQRIEAALARIAHAADSPRVLSASSPQPPEMPTGVAALVEKHERLREDVTQALSELDALLGEIAP